MKQDLITSKVNKFKMLEREVLERYVAAEEFMEIVKNRQVQLFEKLEETSNDLEVARQKAKETSNDLEVARQNAEESEKQFTKTCEELRKVRLIFLCSLFV
jgi:phosphate starvation-inducible protein PhoH